MSAATAPIQKLRDYPVADEPGEVRRPYRLWDSKAKEAVLYAYFKNLRHSHMRALCEAAWAKGDTVIEVFDVRNGGLRGQYRRHHDTVRFWRSSHHLETE